MPKVHHSHQNQKSAAHRTPTNVFISFFFFFFYFTVSLCFSRFSAFLFVCCDEFKSSVKRHKIIFSTSTELQSAVGEKRNVPVLIYCKAENVYALLYRESIVRKYYGHMRSHM